MRHAEAAVAWSSHLGASQNAPPLVVFELILDNSL